MLFSRVASLLFLASAVSGEGYGHKWAQPPDCSKLEIGEEYIPPGEDLLNDLNARLMADVIKRRDQPGNAKRAFHPKTLGCLYGEFKVLEDLAEDLQVGMFKPGATYKSLAHFATSTPIHPPVDGVPLGRSVAIKMYEVPGTKLQPGHQHVNEMDWLFNNAPDFFCPDMVCFSALLTTLARNPLPPSPTGSNLEEYNNIYENGIVPTLEQWANSGFQDAYERLTTENLNGTISGHLGAFTFWTQAPQAFGEGRAVKFTLTPTEPSLYQNDTYPIEDGDFYLKNFKKSIMEDGTPLSYDLFAQFQEDPCTEPIEDSSTIWKTKHIKLGTWTFSDMVSDDSDRTCANIGFYPYLVTKEFKPIGGLNRGRLDAYSRVIRMRQGFNLYHSVPKDLLAETAAQVGIHDTTRPLPAADGTTHPAIFDPDTQTFTVTSDGMAAEEVSRQFPLGVPEDSDDEP